MKLALSNFGVNYYVSFRRAFSPGKICNHNVVCNIITVVSSIITTALSCNDANGIAPALSYLSIFRCVWKLYTFLLVCRGRINSWMDALGTSRCSCSRLVLLRFSGSFIDVMVKHLAVQYE